MEEFETQDRPGFFSRLSRMLTRPEEDGEEMETPEPRTPRATTALRPSYRYAVTVRRHIQTFEDAVAAADGFKRGEQQVLNLSSTEATLREKIRDFLLGVNYAQEGDWQEVGEHVYLMVPAYASVEVASAAGRAARN